MKQPYSVTRDYTIQEGCPWYEAQQKFGPPNLNLCEKSSCSYFNEPANTWSNLSIILLGALLIKKISDPLVRFFAISIVVMGICSFVYHATSNLLTQYIDFVGMFITSSFLLTFNLLRILKKDVRKIHIPFTIIFLLHSFSLILVHTIDFPIQYTLILASAPTILFDIISGYREQRMKEYSFFALAFFSILIAQGCAIIDAQRIYCNPNNLFLHGHVFWHFLSGASMFFYGLHINRMLKHKST